MIFEIIKQLHYVTDFYTVNMETKYYVGTNVVLCMYNYQVVKFADTLLQIASV